MKKIESYKEQPERIPDEKVEVVFHQGKRLGPCFGEHSFDFKTESVRGTHRPDAAYYYSYPPPDHFNCRSSSAGFYRRTVSKVEEDLVRKMKAKMDELIREAFLK